MKLVGKSGHWVVLHLCLFATNIPSLLGGYTLHIHISGHTLISNDINGHGHW